MIYLILFLLLLHMACLYRPPVEEPARVELEEQPMIRVGILEDRTRADFATADPFQIVDEKGTILASGEARSVWRATVRDGGSAETVYILEVATTRDRPAAEQLVAELRNKGIEATIDVLGKAVEVGGRVFKDQRRYRVRLAGTSRSRQTAKRVQERIGRQVWTTIVSIPSDKSNGVLVLTDARSGSQVTSRTPVQVTGSRVALKAVETGTGYHYEKSENRLYRGDMEFRIDPRGKIMVINIVSIEDYLRGVVPFEMHGDFPLEALKAQAVAARTEALYSMTSRHADDPYDVCDDTHCQVYGGIAKETQNTNTAVTSTAGLVLTYEENLCEAVYCGMCGGHTEHNENVWQGDPIPYLRGVPDMEHGRDLAGRYDLSVESNLRSWVTSTPRVYCNTQTQGIPDALNYTRDNFRWEVRRTPEELRRTVAAVAGQDPGPVWEITPVSRGVSGRLISVQVRGTQGTVTVTRELSIRKAFSDPPLRSACFSVEKTRGGVTEFVFRGGGSGHGVGMCQTGAAMMALAGKTFSEILNHYYTGVEITRLY